MPNMVRLVTRGRLKAVQKALNKGADPSETLRGTPLLHYAADSGDVDMIVALIGAGADANAVDLAGLTAAARARAGGHERAAAVVSAAAEAHGASHSDLIQLLALVAAGKHEPFARPALPAACAGTPFPALTLRDPNGAHVSSSVLSEHALTAIHRAMPGPLQLRAWQLAFSTARDGCAPRTFRAAAAAKAPLVMALRTTNDECVGAFFDLGMLWDVCAPSSVDFFVFGGSDTAPPPVLPEGEVRSKPRPPCPRAPVVAGAPAALHHAVSLYHSGHSSVQVSFGRRGVSVGGGDGYAISVAPDLRTGTACCCEPLQIARPLIGGGSDRTDFSVRVLELWSLPV